MKFLIEQVALCPADPDAARELLAELGLDDWFGDTVRARGSVRGVPERENVANLAFNYQASHEASGPEDARPLELEVLHYTQGDNWMAGVPASVSHLGMHCTDEQLAAWRAKFAELGIPVAQEVYTQEHTNPVIAGQRWYQYVIFNTRPVLGVDLKFIVRRASPGEQS